MSFKPALLSLLRGGYYAHHPSSSLILEGLHLYLDLLHSCSVLRCFVIESIWPGYKQRLGSWKKKESSNTSAEVIPRQVLYKAFNICHGPSWGWRSTSLLHRRSRSPPQRSSCKHPPTDHRRSCLQWWLGHTTLRLVCILFIKGSLTYATRRLIIGSTAPLKGQLADRRLLDSWLQMHTS